MATGFLKKDKNTSMKSFQLKDYISEADLDTFCRNHHILKMSLFGSALRGELQPDSDIDILVEFDENHIPGLLDLAHRQCKHQQKETEADMSYQFPPDVEQRIRHQIALGNYTNEDDVLRDALDALDARNADMAAIRAGVEDMEADRMRPIGDAAGDIRRKHGWKAN